MIEKAMVGAMGGGDEARNRRHPMFTKEPVRLHSEGNESDEENCPEGTGKDPTGYYEPRTAVPKSHGGLATTVWG